MSVAPVFLVGWDSLPWKGGRLRRRGRPFLRSTNSFNLDDHLDEDEDNQNHVDEDEDDEAG